MTYLTRLREQLISQQSQQRRRTSLLPLLLASLCLLLTFTSFTTTQVRGDAWSSDVASSHDSWLPLELDTMGSVNSLVAAPTHSMTDRELFDIQSTMTGLPPKNPEPPCLGLNLVCDTPPTVYYCRPTLIPGVRVQLYPNDTVAQAALGNVVLVLNVSHGDISFTVTDGVTFNGGSVGTRFTTLTGPLDAMNAVLATLLFGPDTNFFGYASIEWHLSNQGGASVVPPTHGTLWIVVGSISIIPVLVPLSPSGVLGNFTMKELTTSDSFPGVAVSDGSGTEQTIYRVTIQSFEGSIVLGSDTGLTYAETSKPEFLDFECLPNDMSAALATFKFKSSAFGAYNGNAGFVIVVENTFHHTTGFIQASITNVPNQPKPVDGQLRPPVVTEISSNSAKATWQATPVGFNPNDNKPAPSSYIVETATSSAGPWSKVYSGASLTTSITGLTSATVYYVHVIPVNAGGNGLASPATIFTTLPVKPGQPTGLKVTDVSSHSVSLAWTASTGLVNMYTVVAQQTEKVGTDTGKFSFIAAVPAFTVSGLSSGVSYTFWITANNAAGASSPSSPVVQTTLGSAPIITSYVASGPVTSKPNVYSANVTLTINFDVDTNKPDVSSTAALNALFSFNPSIGSAYTGSWSNPHTLSIDIVDAGSASPLVGFATVSVIGALKSAGGSSDSRSQSPALSGSFGTMGSVVGALFIKGDWSGISLQDQTTSIGVGVDGSKLQADGSYQLVAAVISPKLPGSYLAGSGFTPNGLAISVVGAPSALSSAIDTLKFTPAPGFAGAVTFSFSLTNKGTGALLAGLIVSLTVKPSSQALSISAPDMVNVLLEQFTTVQGITIDSSDSNAQNSIYSVYITTSHTGSALFSAKSDGVNYATSVGTEAKILEISGPIASVNDALSKIQVKFTFSSNSAQNYAPDPYTITVEAKDQSNADNHAIRSISASVQCPDSGIASVGVAEARLDDSTNGFVVTLDKAVSDAYLSSPGFDCASFFDDDSVGTFGDSPSCQWTSTTSFHVTFGLGAKFVLANELTIKDGALQRCAGASGDAPEVKFNVKAPLNPATPTVFISGATTTSLCNSLVLQGITSMTGGRTPTFTWVLPRNLNPTYAPTVLDQAILEVNAQAFGDGGDFEFSLTVTNYLGATSTVSKKTVKATNLPIPLIFPTSVTEIETTAKDTVRIYNSITTNPCFNEPLKPLVFEWSVTPALPTGNTIVQNTANLVIPHHTLRPNTVYTATLKASIATNLALFSTIDYTINVRSSPLAAKIAGGAWRKVRVDAEGWTVDASASTDPDAFGTPLPADYTADKYTYSWKCTTQDGVACFTTQGNPVSITGKKGTFSAGSLAVGLYLFEFTYSHASTNRIAVVSTQIQIREGVDATPYGAFGTVDVLLDAQEQVVNPDGKVHLSATLPGYFNDSRTDLVWVWTVLGGGSTPVDLNDLTNVQGLGTSNLIVNSHELTAYFVQGTDYHFKVTVSHKDDPQVTVDAGSALVYVRINSLPVCDSFTSTPTDDAVAFNTSFVLNAINCHDTDTSSLLQYTFFRLDEQGNRFNLLPSSQSPLGRVPFLPTGSALTLGVVVQDTYGGKQEYTKDIKVGANSHLATNGIAVLKSMYTQTWAPNMAISGDSAMLLSMIASVLTEVNELAKQGGVDASELLEFKRSLLTDIISTAAILPSIQVLQAIYEGVEDSKNLDLNFLGTTLDFIATREQSEPGTSSDKETLSSYLQILKTSLDYVVTSTGVVIASGGNRRLFAMDTINMAVSKEVGVASTSTAATPSSILGEIYDMLNLLALDASSNELQLAGEIVPFELSQTNGFTGAVGRGAAGSAANVSTTDGYSVLASASAFSDLASGAFYDLSVFGTNPVPYIGLISSADAAKIISGGASVSAFKPTAGAASTAVSSFSGVSVEIPFNIPLSSCTQGSYTPPTTDARASGNVFGNLCKLGCKQWSNGAFVDGVIAAVYPLSRKAVCNMTGSGIAVVSNTVLTEPYVIPAEDQPITGGDGSTDPSQPKFQPNGLPWGVVRASMYMSPAPTIFDLNQFKSTVTSDFASVLAIPGTRSIVQAVSASGGAATIIWDFLAPTDASPILSQDLYNNLKGKSATDKDVQSTQNLKNVEWPTIQQLCDDNEYREDCSNTGSSKWASWILPLIIAGCCLVVILVVSCIILGCVRLRRATVAKQVEQPVLVGDVQPAKKFVYTAPNGQAVDMGESMSDITIRPSGMEFEPSTHVVSNNSNASEEQSKNRLSAKFPMRTPPAGAVSGLGAAAAEAEPSRSSHHFYYVDESKVAGAQSGVAATPMGSERRASRSGSSELQHQGSAHFTIESRNEFSQSGSAGPVLSQHRPDSPVASPQHSARSLQRQDSTVAASSPASAAAAPQASSPVSDKSALPVLRPTKSPKQ